jgi:ATP-binding protein involved in chromosome partitioning
MSTPNPFDQQRAIPGIKHTLVVSSGKGGVGKSTVAFHLAHALSQKLRVGLLDADIHGPSLPRLSGTLHQKPEIDAGQRLYPITRWGMPLLSMGHIVEENSALVWRGPMLFKALQQLLFDVNWGELDLLVIDLPPGTGDVQLTLAQKIPLTAAISVTTPQNLALADVKRSVDMWKRVGVKNLGLVENMAYFSSDPQSEKISIFPRGQIDEFLAQHQLPLLATLPLSPLLAKSSEAGVPIMESAPQSAEAQSFRELAELVKNQLGL